MKRPAEDELVSGRTAPAIKRDNYNTPQFSESANSEPKYDGDGASTGGDGASADDRRTEGTEGAQSTPVTTAVSTSSRRFPSDLKTIRCTWPSCTKTFNRPARLTAHLRSHNNDRPFRCADCAKTYMEEKHLRQHVKGSHSQERRYVCGECSRAFLTATRLRRHAAVHEGQDRFRCRGYDDACTRTFRKHQTLQRHVRVDHLGQPAFACSRSGAGSGSICGALFESAGALRRHVTREHGAAKYWCEECLASEEEEEDAGGSNSTAVPSAAPRRAGFATKALLEAHMRQEHVGCLFCDVRCAGPAALHRHIDMYHSGKTVADRKTIVCPHDRCGKAFTRRANLNVHIRAAHEGLRFVCGDADALGAVAASGGDASSSSLPSAAAITSPELALWDASTRGCGRGFVSKMKLEEHILYVHLQLERPPPPVTTMTVMTTVADDAAATAGILDDLAGTKRTLSCPLAGCAARFVRHHDLRAHQQREHSDAGLGSGSAEAAGSGMGDLSDPGAEGFPLLVPPPPSHGVADYRGDDGGYFLGPDADLVEDGSNMFNLYMDLGPTPTPGESETAGPGDEAQWQIDEAEMRRLIGDSCGGNGADYLDPKLFA